MSVNRVSSCSPRVCWYRFFCPHHHHHENEGEHVERESGEGGSKVLSSVHTFVSTGIKCALCVQSDSTGRVILMKTSWCACYHHSGVVRGSIIFLN